MRSGPLRQAGPSTARCSSKTRPCQAAGGMTPLRWQHSSAGTSRPLRRFPNGSAASRVHLEFLERHAIGKVNALELTAAALIGRPAPPSSRRRSPSDSKFLHLSQSRLNDFLRSAGSAQDRAALLSGPFWRRDSSGQDGRSSEAMFGLVETNTSMETTRDGRGSPCFGCPGAGVTEPGRRYGRSGSLRDEGTAQKAICRNGRGCSCSED